MTLISGKPEISGHPRPFAFALRIFSSTRLLTVIAAHILTAEERLIMKSSRIPRGLALLGLAILGFGLAQQAFAEENPGCARLRARCSGISRKCVDDETRPYINTSEFQKYHEGAMEYCAAKYHECADAQLTFYHCSLGPPR